MNIEQLTTVTYNLINGGKIVQPINKECLVDEKGKKRSLESLKRDIFEKTAIDKSSSSYTLEGSIEEPTNVKEIHFTKAEKKQARKDYNDIKSENPAGHAKKLQQFKNELIDKFGNNKRRLRFNLVKISA